MQASRVARKEIVLHGVAASGLGKAGHFTQLAWVQRQLADKLGMRPWPGTFNVRVTDGPDRVRWAKLLEGGGVEITLPSAASCAARCYRANVNGRIAGAIIVPDVPGYPADQIEILAEQCIRTELHLADGDPVTLRVDDEG